MAELFGDDTQQNRNRGARTFDRAQQTSLGANVNTSQAFQPNQRNQAGSGTLGTTLGDNSGTGANTPEGGTVRATTPSTNTGQESREAAFGYLDRLDRQVRRGAISARSAGNIAARILGDIQSTSANRFRTETGAATDLAGQQSAVQRNRESIAGSFREALAGNVAALDRAQLSRQTDLDLQRSREGIAEADRTLGIARLAETQRAAQAREAAEQDRVNIARNELGLRERATDAEIARSEALTRQGDQRLRLDASGQVIDENRDVTNARLGVAELFADLAKDPLTGEYDPARAESVRTLLGGILESQNRR